MILGEYEEKKVMEEYINLFCDIEQCIKILNLSTDFNEEVKEKINNVKNSIKYIIEYCCKSQK